MRSVHLAVTGFQCMLIEVYCQAGSKTWGTHHQQLHYAALGQQFLVQYCSPLVIPKVFRIKWANEMIRFSQYQAVS